MLAEADMSVTQMAMGQEGQHAGDEQLGVVFYTHPKQNAKKTKEAGRPIYEDREYIRIVQPGNKDSIVERPATDMDRARFPRHYQAYKSRVSESETVEGTLLEHWPGVSRSQVAELKYLNIITVEQLANLADSNAQGMMGINMYKQKAKAYLDASEVNKAAEELQELRDSNALMKAQLEDMRKRMDAQEDADDRPKRRRRTKAEMEADAQSEA